ncbi:PAS domain-containing sensor histidine kinase [bacterium]|nr:PAS domain-containing sensor histidine kinase [bacterium]MBU1435501.1 PAS domain-containing sensor histidine kinase [bacterium]MBU1502575.1 PAS domain-containing sensor histidine kinase [bacterium]
MLKQYKEAIEKSNIISKTDTKGIITFVNDEFCKISGYSKEELLGKNHNIVRHPDVPSENFKLLWDTINAKEIYKATVKNLAKDGSTFYVNTTLIPILDAHDNIAEFIAIRYDVTKEVFFREELQKKELQLEELNKNLEKRVEEKTKELKELNQTLELRVKDEVAKNEQKQRIMFWQSRLASLGQMLANVAHQWRQPLTELNLAVFSIKKAALSDNKEDVVKFYAESVSIVKNMSKTIDDFTNFFKPDKEKHYFKIDESVNEALVILEKLIKKEMIHVKTDFEEVEVLGITNELTQVIINLIKNSRDAFVQNSILMREISIRTKKEKNYVLLEFGDNAGGIKEKDLEKIFEPYFSTKHASQGTGLGLFMSRMICEQGLNGMMDVKSKRGITTFSITIPLEEKNEK